MDEFNERDFDMFWWFGLEKIFINEMCVRRVNEEMENRTKIIPYHNSKYQIYSEKYTSSQVLVFEGY